MYVHAPNGCLYTFSFNKSDSYYSVTCYHALAQALLYGDWTLSAEYTFGLFAMSYHALYYIIYGSRTDNALQISTTCYSKRKCTVTYAVRHVIKHTCYGKRLYHGIKVFIKFRNLPHPLVTFYITQFQSDFTSLLTCFFRIY